MRELVGEVARGVVGRHITGEYQCSNGKSDSSFLAPLVGVSSIQNTVTFTTSR